VNLGVTLRILGEREPDTERLAQAVAAFREALEELTRERVPLQWAETQMNLGSALASLGERESDTARLQEAKRAIEAAYALYREAGYSQYNASLEERLKSLDQLIATRSSLTPITP
jgi:tetratricopeptide (TPR) repeat protein